MRLVLSRKGFDASSGGCPSPIFPDGAMLSLPIPDKDSDISYSVLSPRGMDVGRLVAELSGNVNRANRFAHLDPDLESGAIPRSPGWRPLLGQTGAAQGHLRKQGVGVGDLLLFFGLFQRVEQSGGVWRFVRNARKLHVLWGWLQIGEVHKVAELGSEDLSWARYHPHFRGDRGSGNTLYVAADNLCLNGKQFDVPGAGVFPRFNKRLVLTDERPGSSCSQWRLPSAFYPDSGKPPLSYHGEPRRWRHMENTSHCGLQSVSRGQEFVLGLEYYPEVLDWLESMLIA